MLKLNLVVAAVAAAAFALPAVAASTAGEGSIKKAGEPIVVEASRFAALPGGDPGFAFTGAEGGWEVVQHSYGRIDGVWGHTDKLVHSDAPFVRYTTAEAMGIVQEYPGA